MNLIDIKNKLKKHSTLDAIWRLELTLGILLGVVFLIFDLWIYSSYVKGGAGGPPAPEVATLLKKNGIEKAADKIKSQNDFLVSPVFPVVKNPF